MRPLPIKCYKQPKKGNKQMPVTDKTVVMGIKQRPLAQLATGHVKMTVSLGPQRTLVTGTKTKPVTVNSISETRVVNLRLRCLNERATYW
jgi:hypothetical protein